MRKSRNRFFPWLVQTKLKCWIPPWTKASTADRPTASPLHISPAAAPVPVSWEQIEQALRMFGCLEAAVKPSGDTSSLHCRLGQCSNWHVWLDPLSNCTQAGEMQRGIALLQLCLPHVEASLLSCGWWVCFFYGPLLLLFLFVHCRNYPPCVWKVGESCTPLCFCLFTTTRIQNGNTKLSCIDYDAGSMRRG